MINWFNMPVEGLSNGGQFEIKELTATENKTYEKDGEVYNKVTVNVSGGGGGSSDFSTANVTIVGGDNGLVLTGRIQGMTEGYIFIKSDEYGDVGVTTAGAQAESSITAKALLFKNLDESIPHDFYASFNAVDTFAIGTVDGDCEYDEETEIVIIWGDCTITGGTPK